MPVTIRDVAERLKVSITTVSRALDGYDDVAEGTRELVARTAREMDYVPHRAARQLRRQKAETIGFIIPSVSKRFNEPFFTEFMAGLGEEISSRNFDLLVSNATSDEGERELYHRWANSHKVDGFILNRIRNHDWRVNLLAQWGIPFAALGRSHDGIEYSRVRIDGAEAMHELIRHIHGHGFSRFAFVGGPGDLINQIDRLRWFASALKKCGMEADRESIVLTDMTSTGGYDAARRLLSAPTPPDAIISINDETAFGVLHAAHAQGLEIGTDIAVAGFDGVQQSGHTEPPLTTLEIPVGRIAQQLSRMLVEQLSGKLPEAQEFIVRPELHIRASTGG